VSSTSAGMGAGVWLRGCFSVMLGVGYNNPAATLTAVLDHVHGPVYAVSPMCMGVGGVWGWVMCVGGGGRV